MLGIPLFRFISRSVRQISETNRKSSIIPLSCSQVINSQVRYQSSRQAINSQVRYLRQASSSWHLWRQASSASHLRRQGSSSSPSTASGLWAGQLLPSPSKYLHNNNKKWDNYICIHGTSTLLQKILPLRLQVQDSDQSIRRTFEMLQHRLNHVFSVLRGSF